MTAALTTAVPDLAALQRRAAERAAERAGGDDRLRGHIVCDGLVRIYKTEGVEVVALQGLDLVIDRGELLAIVGASGSGKSTAAQHPVRAGRADRRHRPGGRVRPADHVGEAAAALPPAHGRVRLAADRAQPAAVPDRAGERGAADAAGPRVVRTGGPQAGAGAAGDGRGRLLRGPAAGPDERRRAAAVRGGGGGRERPRGALRRRADR